MKALHFIYRETEINFLIGNDNDVMINATEMANVFDKKPVHFLRNEQTENFIKTCCTDINFHRVFGYGTKFSINEDELGGAISHRQNNFGTANSQLQNKILTEQERRDCLFQVKSGGRNNGTWMHEILALKFAAWLDADFEFWVFFHIREITFGNYKKHWDAHVKQENAKLKMEILKAKLLKDPTPDDALEYFKAEQDYKDSRTAKMRAIKSQYQLELGLFEETE